jgi:hypothetical protein
VLDLTRFCALCGAALKISYWDDDDLDTMGDCSCCESGSSYNRRLRHESKFGPSCKWFEEAGDILSERYVTQGPICGKPARFISCVPYNQTLTCEEHKCRCAKPLLNEVRP